MSKLPPPPPPAVGQTKEKICEMRTIVQKVAVDEMTVRSFVEKEKTGFYAKLGVFKPKPEEIVCEAITLYYEQYVVAKANYTVDYYRRKMYSIRVEPTVKEVVVFDKTLQPGGQEKGGKQISLEVRERVATSVPAHICLDKAGKETDSKKLPMGTEETDSMIVGGLSSKLRSPAASPDSVVSMIRSRIVKRPQDIEKVIEEMFEVTELSAIYTPIYETHLRNLKTGVIKVIPVSGITGKVYSV